ncbi:MAG: hypothetical protein KGI97_01335 [Alphaproteobacteria bacterium]|nr:hypothetical protein [Alphaproteobacteria bacterium]
MRSFPYSCGGERTPVEDIKRDGWREQGILVVSIADSRLTWPEKELLCQIGEKLYGKTDIPVPKQRHEHEKT